MTISGNLTVTGTTTQNNTVATTTKVFTLASGSANDAAADGGGIAVDSAAGDKTWLWVDATNAWTSSEHIQVAAGKVFGFADDTNTFIDSPAADRIDFTLGNSEIFKFTTDTLELTTSSATPAVFAHLILFVVPSKFAVFL